MFKKVLSFCCFICIISHISYSQTDVLNTKISYSASNKPLTEVLRDIEKLTNFRFTFNSSIIPDTEIVTITIQQQSLDEALTLLLKNKYSYKLFGNQILITEFQQDNQPSGSVRFFSPFLFHWLSPLKNINYIIP